jgi:hypothetical protein
MAAGSTYTPIATNTVSGGSTNSVAFSSISGSYTDLVIVAKIFPTADIGGQNMYIRFNSDTSTNYSSTTMLGNGTAASSSRLTSQTGIGRMDFYTAANPTATLLNVQNYSNSTTYKNVLIRHNVTDNGTKAIVGLWRSTSAITSLEMYIDAGFYGAGSTFTLYGIASA